ncbi:recombination mediator RecR [Magnetovibrio sp. PR-2]|uniref:recombination mediator RecR n=1 Tax=Magnetovibrio sp. PR-2 TaxID=3120356 RepID=UPI002FCDE733
MSGPGSIDALIGLLAKLPGLGPRSARRAALHLIKRRESLMEPLARALSETADSVKTCSVCGNIDTIDPCTICTGPKRDRSQICVVEEIGDLWAMERVVGFQGLYHVLGGTLSALDGVGPEDLRVGQLIERAKHEGVTEVILATNATVDGQTTAHYIAERLDGANVRVSGLAHGVPVGGELDYLDEGTLSTALKARKPV